MTAIGAPGTKRMRQAKRRLREVKRDRDWVLTRLRRETDPEALLRLRELLQEMGQAGLPVFSGIEYQISRLPAPDGPSDCVGCQVVYGPIVPVKDQRVYEDGLHVVPASAEAVYEMPAYKPTVTGKGRGFIARGRLNHADHLDLYTKWKFRE